MKIYEGNSKAWDFLIISLTDITSGLVSQCDENAHHARKDLIDKYEVSDEKKESLNEVKNRWNNCRNKETIQYPDIWFNKLYKQNLKFKNIKSRYEKNQDKVRSYVFGVLTEE